LLFFFFSVHLKIHIPTIKHNHKHTKTKYIHVFHPKVVHSDHSSVQFLHSRRDPNIGSNGGYPQPLVNLQEHQPELRITEEEFMKWRQEQLRKALEEQKRVQEEQNNNPDSDNEGEDESYDGKKYEDVDETAVDEEYTNDLYKKHKANKANSSSGRKELLKHNNHNYNQDFGASNADKTYANYAMRATSKRKTPKTPQYIQSGLKRPRKNAQKQYGFVAQPDSQASNVQLQYLNVDPTVLDPTYYSTLPRDQTEMNGSDDQDEIYSGLMSRKYNKKTADKSRLLGDINYNRKTQTKLFASRRKDQ
jgi:hypothetical protein